MELEKLFDGNPIIIYFIGTFYILINISTSKNQKIVMLYVFTYILKLFDIMDIKIMLILLNIVAFLYVEYLTDDEVKNVLLTKFYDKIKDYIYKCIFEYSSIWFIISNVIISNKMKKIIYNELINLGFYNNNLILSIIKVSFIIISVIFLVIAISNITSERYETNNFTEIKKKMDKVALWTKIKANEIDFDKLNMLVCIEDKSYFIRENSYNFLSLEFLKYKFNRIKNRKITSTNIRRVINKRFSMKHLRTFIRGYSTIEMQIIRTLGVKYGYNEHVICRKVYELLYSEMFFKNLRRYMNKVYLNTKGCCTYKQYLLVIYINIAQVVLNNNTYKNMLKPWNNAKNINELSNEEFFISILGLSHRKITYQILYNYSSVIERFSLNVEKIKKLIKKFN